MINSVILSVACADNDEIISVRVEALFTIILKPKIYTIYLMTLMIVLPRYGSCTLTDKSRNKKLNGKK